MELERTIAATGGPGGAMAGPDGSEALSRGAAVGRYILVGVLGAGGMGVVHAAYDPELDRKVALKLLLPGAGGGADTRERARLLREAQALAKLSHPNVVTVHDAGTHGDRVWIAMEYVAGRTLGAWAEAAPRRWPEVLEVLTGVARGVAAAHAAGLVHRDLKPDNVMIGDDGRVRVMDFGLAHGRTQAPAEPDGGATLPEESFVRPELAALSLRLTADGSIQGTPAYMAPEQWQGQEAEAAADQFGWSVMAWELLYGERPFVADTLAGLRSAVLAGRRRPPPPGRRVPGWLRRLVERGLSVEPAQRWPGMAALLEALGRGRTRARVRGAAAVLAGVAALVAGGEGVRRWDVARREAACEATSAAVDAVWNDEARRRVRGAFVATGVSYAETTADRVVPWLDEQTAWWKRARADACMNAEVRGAWSEELRGRAVFCLEDRQMELEALVGEFARADATVVQAAVTAAASLRTAETCMDEPSLRRGPAPPEGGREGLREVRAALSQARALLLAGNYRAGLAAATAAREQTEARLDWPPLWASARAQEGVLLEKLGAYAEAEAASMDAYDGAVRAGAWEVAAGAATDLVFIVGNKQARHADGRAWARHAEAVAVHAGDRAGLREAARLQNLGVVEWAAGAYAEARALNERALAMHEQALGPDHFRVVDSLSNLAVVYKATGEQAKAQALGRRAAEIRERVLGPDHPEVADSLNNLANLLEPARAYAEARALHERALAIRERALGPDHLRVADSLNNLGVLHAANGAYAEARALHERALDIRERSLGDGHPDVADSLNNLADVSMALGAHAEAGARYERALAIWEKSLGPDHPDVATGLYNLACVREAAGATAEARALHERALAIWEKALGPDHPDVAASLRGLARLHLAAGEPGAAVPLLERALTIFAAHAGVQPEEFEAHFDLAVALVATDGDRARALAEAHRARDGLRAGGAGKAAALAEVERWLGTHGGGR